MLFAVESFSHISMNWIGPHPLRHVAARTERVLVAVPRIVCVSLSVITLRVRFFFTERAIVDTPTNCTRASFVVYREGRRPKASFLYI